MALPPEVSMGPLRQTLSWTFRPLRFLEDCRRRHGDVFGVTFLGFERPMYMLSDPTAIKALYSVDRESSLPPGRTVFLEPILGSRSLLLLEGADHLAHRKLMLPAFHGERMRSYEPMVAELVEREIDGWPVGTEFALHPRMQAVTLEVILRVVFGVAEGPRLERLRGLLKELLAQTGNGAAQLLAMVRRRLGQAASPWERLETTLAEIDELLLAEIAEHRRREDLEERDDILSALVMARFEDGGGLSDEDLRDQMLTLLLAGHETTATALAWSFDLLLRHPQALQRLRESLEDGHDDYLRATISESLRLRPVVPLAGRRLNTELRVGEHTLPAGSDVTPAIWLAHTRAESYPEPLAFRPERFLDDSPETYAWVPFGGGIRRCIGGAFAEFEMRIVLRAVLARCELRKADPAAERLSRRNITLSPRDGTRVVLTARRPAGERQPVPA